MKRIARSTLQTSVNLVFFAVIGTAILSSTYYLTRDTIAATVAQAKLKLVSQLLPPTSYDNDIMQDRHTVAADEMLGTEEATQAHIARRDGKPVAVILEAIAPDGYSGKIALIMAIHPDGSLGGVRVVSHNETPGLGDYIDIAKQDWIKTFDGRSRSLFSDEMWKVRKDGGMFDYMAGATITPRAVIKAVNRALQYFEAHRDELFVADAQPAKGAAK
ncbi:MAG: electron transport complex subunit RsxG [Sideroxydans sp.]|nr:electron transport complex subunit RsxG [Sideroxydans sp.]